jgi:hypothetical protein
MQPTNRADAIDKFEKKKTFLFLKFVKGGG